MIFSDLPTPAEALVHTTMIMPGLRAGGKPVPTRIKSGAGFFGIMPGGTKPESGALSGNRGGHMSDPIVPTQPVPPAQDPLRDPVPPPTQDPPAQPFRDPVVPPQPGPGEPPVHDPQPPPYQDPPQRM